MLRARCRNLFQAQNADDPLWILCVVKKVPLSTVAQHYGNSLKVLISSGLNRNMLTRDRWFDVDTIASLGGFEVIERLKVDTFQYHSWQLSFSEMDRLGIRWNQVEARFGTEFCREEQQRLGVLPTPQATIQDHSDFYTEFGAPMTVRNTNLVPARVFEPGTSFTSDDIFVL